MAYLVASFSGHLLLHFLVCIRDLLRSHMCFLDRTLEGHVCDQENKSGRQPGNKATYLVYMFNITTCYM